MTPNYGQIFECLKAMYEVEAAAQYSSYQKYVVTIQGK